MSKKIRNFPKSIRENRDLVNEALSLGCVKAQVIPTRTIALGHWLRLQCQFGCPHYGKSLSCPPFTPMVDEVSDVLMEYKNAVLIQAEESDKVSEVIIALEKKLKHKGFRKAFGLCSKPCSICETCTLDTHCEYPEKARPTLRSFGIDVPATVSNNGWDSNSQMDFCENNSIGMVLFE